MTNTYRRRNEVGHLVEVHRAAPSPEQAILQAYVAVFRAPPPDDWRAALAELQRAAIATVVAIAAPVDQGTRPAHVAEPLLRYDAERWETL